MTRSLNSRQAGVLVDEILELARGLKKADRDLRPLARDDTGAGYAPSSLGGGGTGGGPTILVPDEDGNPERVAVTGVELLALSAGTQTPFADAQAALWEALEAARAELTEAWNHYKAVTRQVDAPPPKPAAAADLWCRSCIRVGWTNPIGKPKDVGESPLCHWCHDYQRSTGRLPSELLVRRRWDIYPRRLTTRDVDEVAALERRRKAAGKKRRKGKR